MDYTLKYNYPDRKKLLSLSQIRQLFRMNKFNKASKGDIIYFTPLDLPRIYFIKKGSVKIVFIDDEGNEVTKEILLKGDLFGELSLAIDEIENGYAKILTKEASIYSFPLSDFEDFLLHNPAVALHYTKFIGFKMKQFKNSSNLLVSKNTKNRLTLFLKDWALREGIKKGNNYFINNYLTQNDIAQIIGSTRQTAALLLNELQEENILFYNRKEIIIGEIAKL